MNNILQCKFNNYFIDNNFKTAMKLLQDHPDEIDPSDQFNYAIKKASEEGHTEFVRLLLLDSRVDPSIDNNYPIRLASGEGHAGVVELLLQDNRVDPTDMDNKALSNACISGHTEIVRLLLDDRSIDVTDLVSHRFVATKSNRVEIVKLLEEYSGNVKEKKTGLMSELRKFAFSKIGKIIFVIIIIVYITSDVMRKATPVKLGPGLIQDHTFSRPSNPF